MFIALEECGLNDFCLTLHNPNAKRKDIIDQLGASMDLAKSKIEINEETVNELIKLTRVRSQLNEYSKQLHTPVSPLGKTVYQVNGLLAEFNDCANIDYVQCNARNFTSERLTLCSEKLEELADIIKESGYESENLWNGCILNEINFEFRQKFITVSDELSSQIEKGKHISNEFNKLIGDNGIVFNYESIKNIIEICTLSLNHSDVKIEWIYKINEDAINLTQNGSDMLYKKNSIQENKNNINIMWKKYTILMNTLIEKVINNNDAETENLQNNCSSCFKTLLTELDSTEFSEVTEKQKYLLNSINDFEIANKLYNESILNYNNSINEYNEICREFNQSIKDFDEEQKLLSKEKDDLTSLRNSVLSYLKESVLFIDSKSLFKKYTDIYMSLNEELKLYQKENSQKEFSYEDILVVLNKVLQVQNTQQEYNNALLEYNSKNTVFLQEQEDMENKKASIISDYDEEILTIDAKSMLDKFILSYKSFLRFFNSDYHKDNKYLENKKKINGKLHYEDAIGLLNNIIEYQESVKKCENAKKLVDEAQYNANKTEEKLNNIKGELIIDFNDSIFMLNATDLIQKFTKSYDVLCNYFASYFIEGKVDKTKLTYQEALLLLKKISDINDGQIYYENRKKLVNEKRIKCNNLQSDESIKKINLEKTSCELNALKQKRIIQINNLNSNFECLISSINSVISTREKNLEIIENDFKNTSDKLLSVMGIELNWDTDFSKLISEMKWLLSFQKAININHLNNSFVNKLFNDNELCISLGNIRDELSYWAGVTTPNFNYILDLFNQTVRNKYIKMPLVDFVDEINNLKQNYFKLEYYIDYKNLRKQLENLEIQGYLEKIEKIKLPANQVVKTFMKCFYRSWLDAVTLEFKELKNFRGQKQNEKITKFKTLDKNQLDISKAALKARLVSRLPVVNSSMGGDEVSVLRRELMKRRKHMPLRKLISEIPTLLPTLKPCMLMSPLSVSTYFRNSDYEFDTVIFDEASQVRTEDAICSIFRAKQAIIAGDSKQLPPTDFFTVSAYNDNYDYEDIEEDQFNDLGAYESLLDEASMLPTRTLLWHYRSKHEHLIAFSNKKIYNGKLITFPSAIEKEDDIGVEYVYVENGIYERGSRNGNRIEADKVADMVFEHLKNHPDRSLGIIAFGGAQQIAIEDAILKKRQQNVEFEYFFSENMKEPIFIKNLETVQGDERDTIIFSIGYAKDINGKFIMNFGPLNQRGGERRLNVAVTRARYNLKLVGSILPTDIDLSKVNSDGQKLLSEYIDFAINGESALNNSNVSSEAAYFESPFEESVYDFITAHGYDVKTQVGCSGYRIDMAICHPEYNGRFVLGIECDGATYHSARTARERDRLRQEILESMGWKIYRIWSTDWIKDPNTEGEKLLSVIKNAISNYSDNQINNLLHQDDNNYKNYADICQKTDQDVIDEINEQFLSPYAGHNAKEIPYDDYENTMLKLIQYGFGYTKQRLFDETAKYGYQWKRKGNTIMNCFEQAYQRLLSKKKIREEDGKIILIQSKQ